MTETRCPACQRQMASDAVSCAWCAALARSSPDPAAGWGDRANGTTAPRRIGFWGLIGIALGAFALLVGITNALRSPEERAAAEARLRLSPEAKTACMAAVRAQLTNPLTLEVREGPSFACNDKGCRMEMLFDAKNGFGGTLTYRTECIYVRGQPAVAVITDR